MIPDDRDADRQRLATGPTRRAAIWCSPPAGPGSRPHDVTPEATRAVIEREAPGIAGGDAGCVARAHHALDALARRSPGSAGDTLIVNFPGSPSSIGEAGEAIAAALPHALELVAGKHPH